jgi:hypothetical protein
MHYIIIGAGGFGLHTALELRYKDPSAKITILDKDINMSSTINGQNSIIKKESTDNIIDLYKSTSLKKYKNKININKINNLEWFIIHTINYVCNNKQNRNKINEIVNNTYSKDCPYSDQFDSDHWSKINMECLNNSINIISNTEVINYTNTNNKIILNTTDNNINYECDKLILCTSNDFNLIKNDKYKKYINTFSGIIIIAKVKNVPKCFSHVNNTLIAPYQNDLVKISILLELGLDNKYSNYNIDKSNPEYKKIEDYIAKDGEIDKLGIQSIENIWYGVRAMTYDILPFFTQVDKNVYWMSGGSYNGAQMSKTFANWFVDYILYNKINKSIIDPTINRLYKIRTRYYTIFLITILIVIIIILHL